MAEHPNHAKMRAAHILPWAAAHTLETFGYQRLHEIFHKKEYLIDGARQNYYLELPNELPQAWFHANKVAALIAKYLLLHGKQPTYVQTILEINRDIQYRSLPRDADLDEKLAAIMGGKGYIVMSDFMTCAGTPVSEILSKNAQREIGDKLASHVYDGGGLVLVGSPIREPELDTFGALTDTIRSSFQVHKLRGKDTP